MHNTYLDLAELKKMCFFKFIVIWTSVKHLFPVSLTKTHIFVLYFVALWLCCQVIQVLFRLWNTL